MAPPTVVSNPVSDGVGRPSQGRRRLHVEIRSVTKDSLGVAWHSDVAGNQDDADHRQSPSTSSASAADLADAQPVISGYKVRYQAVGSTFVQYSHLLRVSAVETCSIFCFGFVR